MSKKKTTTKKTVAKRVVKAPVPDSVKDQIKEFKEFIKSQGLIGMATGLIIGTAAATLVKSLIENIIMPPLGFILGSADGLKGLSWKMGQTASGEMAVLHYGQFLNDLINFTVIAVVVYFIIVAVTKFLGEDHIKK